MSLTYRSNLHLHLLTTYKHKKDIPRYTERQPTNTNISVNKNWSSVSQQKLAICESTKTDASVSQQKLLVRAKSYIQCNASKNNESIKHGSVLNI